MLTLCIGGDYVIELFKKYKVLIFLGMLIIANITWYILKDRNDTTLSVNLAQQNSTAETWNQQGTRMNEETLTAVPLQTPLLPAEINLAKAPEPAVPVKVPVYICGEVLKPGVYYVDSAAIVNQVIEMSGGFTQKADKSSLNLAGLIEPNQKIYVPKIGEQIDKSSNSYDNKDKGSAAVSHASDTKVNTASASQVVNINTATQEELQTLSGIGEVKAKAIIEYRSTVGRFKTIDELLNVSGIGDKTFDKIKPFITI